MRCKTVCLVLGVVVAALLIPSKKASAACIKDCVLCGPVSLQPDGLVTLSSGYKYAECAMESCPSCSASLANSSAAESNPIYVLNKLLVASPADFPRLVSKYKTRLLINEERGLLVVQGTECDKNALSTMAFIPKERLKQMASFRVQSLAAYLDRKQTMILASR